MNRTSFTPKRASRCPVAGFGWLYLRDGHSFSGGPPQANPDHSVSGQNPAYITWGIERIKAIIGDPFYQRQVQDRIAELEKERARRQAAVEGAHIDLERIEAEIAEITALLNAE